MRAAVPTEDIWLERAWPAQTRRASAPQSQSTSDQGSDVGVDLLRRALDQDGSLARLGARRTRPRGRGLHALIRTIRRYRVSQPGREPRA